MAVKQTAGRDALGEFAPKFAELNDDVLFGEVWSREKQLSLRDRSLVTVIALMAQGLTDESFRRNADADFRQGKIEEEKLHQQRRIAKQLNIRADNLPQHGHPPMHNHRAGNAQHQRQRYALPANP